MEDFKSFVEEVEQAEDRYTAEDWVKATEKFDKFSGEWYKEFSDEFTLKENLLIGKYSLEFNILKVKQESKDFIELFNKEDYNEVKEKLQYYIDNDMDEDIEFVKKQAEEVGETAIKSLEEIMNELEHKD